jgi:hypothetical protein
MMRTGDPLFAVTLLGGCALFGLLLWWLAHPGAQRMELLMTIAAAEGAQTAPPTRLLDQGDWLVRHRLGLLRRLSLAWISMGVLGLIEGLDRRRRHPLRGMQYMPFVLGKGSLVFTLSLAAMACFSPRPLPITLLAAVGSLCLVSTTYWLALGVPCMR